MRSPEQLAHGAEGDARVGGHALHGVRLAGARLPVREDAHIVAVKGADDELAHLVEDALLLALRPEHAVEVERLQPGLLSEPIGLLWELGTGGVKVPFLLRLGGVK